MSKAPKAETQADETTETRNDAYGKVSERVAAAYASAGEKLEANPLAALLGGIAIGAIAGALLPRLEKEKELLAPLGEKIGDAARVALDAGKTAGTGALTDAGLTQDQIRGQVSKLVEQALKAASDAGSAALQAARESASANR